jgi:predicted RecA/RadA family phage recombinase
MPESTVVHDASTVNFTAAAALVSGQITQVPDGRAGVVQGDFATGELAAALIRGRVSAAKAGATVFAAGGPVYWDNNTNLAVTATGAGIFRLGLAVYAAGAGTTTVTVDLNTIALIQT